MNLIKLLFLSFVLCACVSKPPHDPNNICSVFKQYPQWKRNTLDVQHRWWVPVPVQMAIIHQESKFNAKAKPPRAKILGFIPGPRPSNAYGYTQALRSTWKGYKKEDGGIWSSRTDFSDAVDFIGWYANKAYHQASIRRDNTYALYLAYHEGIGGYQRKTYLSKPWLIQVAKKVQARAQIYQAQLKRC
jgi:hypothetical protein